MEPEIRHSANGSDRNRTASDSDPGGGTFESWQTSLLLWLPHLSISLLLLLLVLLSFARFHSKHGHRYRKPPKGPRPAWQELGMHDFIRHIHSSVTPPPPPTSVTPPAVDLQVFGWTEEHRTPPPPPLPPVSPPPHPPTPPHPHPHLVRSIADVSVLQSSVPGNAESANSKRRQAEKENLPNSLTSAISDAVTPRISVTSSSSSSSSEAEVTSSSAQSKNNNCGEISRDVSSSSSSQIEARSSGMATVTEAKVDKSGAEPANPPPSEPVQSSSERRGVVPTTAATPAQQKNPRKQSSRPLFAWTLGTDKVGDSTEVDGGLLGATASAAPRIPPRIWMTMERNRASEVVLRSTGPLRAITTVALSKTGSEDEEKLIEKSPI